jgi:hypothetical protein
VSHAAEAVCSLNTGVTPQPCQTAFWVYAAGDYANNSSSTTQPWNFAFAASRTQQAGFDCEINPAGASDTGTYFKKGCFWDQSNSAASLLITGTHGYAVDASAGRCRRTLCVRRYKRRYVQESDVSMTSVQQSGLVTPGHVAIFSTTGVVQDGGALPAAARVLGSGRSYNFNTTADQPIAIPQRVTAFTLTGILITNASIPLTTCVGGFYPQPSKGGVPIVPAIQTYSMLTNSSLLLWATLSSFGQNTRLSSANLGMIAGFLDIWFSLTTPQGAPATGDIYLVGMDLS